MRHRLSLLVLAVGLACGAGLQAEPEPRDPPWILVGTVAGGEHPLAVIAYRDGSEGVAGLGEELSGCPLHAVQVNWVDLACADGHVRVPLKSGLAPAEVTGGRDGSVSRDYTVKQRRLETLFENRERLAREISLLPEQRGGDVYGYRIEHLRAGGPLGSMGLAENDVIVSVNGAWARYPGPFFQTISGLAEMPTFQFRIERGGERLQLHYVLE